MKEKVKKILISIIIIAELFLIYNYSLAHPGNTASDGCHFCRTNCSSWGVAWNQRHCHGGSVYVPSRQLERGVGVSQAGVELCGFR